MSVLDPRELPSVDQAIRHNEIVQRAEDLHVELSDDCPDEVAESFLDHLERWEAAPWVSFAELLRRDGFVLPAQTPVDDGELHSLLWRAIEKLAARHVYLVHTDHLSDRALYEFLLHELNSEATKDLPATQYGACFLDVIGAGSDEDLQVSLRYYDDEPTRCAWHEQFPRDVIPPHEPLPYDRDRLLPKAPGARRRSR